MISYISARFISFLIIKKNKKINLVTNYFYLLICHKSKEKKISVKISDRNVNNLLEY